MSSPVLHPLTVLFASPNGRPQTTGLPLDEGDPSVDVEVAESTDEALDRIDAGRIQSVVCEHRPPRVDAVDFVAAVRERDPALPVLVLPGDGGRDCTRDVLAAGATDVIQTPPESLSSTVLVNRIRQFVRSSTIDDDRRGSSDSKSPATSEDGPSPATPSSPATGNGRDALAGDADTRSGPVLDRLGEAVRDLRRADRREAVADALVDAVADALDVPGVGVFLFDDEENRLRPTAITDAMREYYGGATVFGPGKPDSVTWHAFVTGESIAFDDVRNSGMRVNEETDARGGVFVPLGEHGTLAVSTDVVGAFTESSVEVVDLFATVAETAFDRIANEAVLRQRERRIRRQDDRLEYLDRVNRLLRSVDDAVVEQSSREDVESAVLDCLVDDGRFEFAWIGVPDAETGTLAPRACSGDGRRYLDEISLAVDQCGEPACRTAREWTVTSTSNVAEHLNDDWGRAALARDFHSVLSVPLVYRGVLYGVLTAYADRPDAFQEPVTSVIEQIGRTTAYAVNATEHKHSVLSNDVTELELRVGGGDDVLNVIAETVGATVECVELSPLDDGDTEVLFSVADVSAESVLAATAGLVAVDGVSHVAGEGDHLYTARVSGEMLGSVIATSGGLPESITADGTELVATVIVPGAVEARTFVDRLARRYPDVELLARRDGSATTRVGFRNELESVLTDRQLEVLRTAHDSGFFRSPRDATGQDVADRLDVSQPTVSHHLRAGQGKLFSLLFGDSDQ